MITNKSFFEQVIQIKHNKSRITYLIELIGDKKTLHIGCADWPIYNTENNLHLKLYENNKNLEGFDIDEEIIGKMKEHPLLNNAKLYTKLPEDKYDIIIIPEVIEHLNNVEHFLLSLLDCITLNTQILISGPNAFREGMGDLFKCTDSEFIEIVHPDHNCWYSPYTLTNTIRKVYSKNNINTEIIEIGTFDYKSMVYVLFKINI